jgi:signal transduction histidine kinase
VPTALLGDPRAFSQVLINLIGNAIKFTDQGDVTVSVRSELEEGWQVLLHVCVADTGIGIPVEKQASIFDAFVQPMAPAPGAMAAPASVWPFARTWSS